MRAWGGVNGTRPPPGTGRRAPPEPPPPRHPQRRSATRSARRRALYVEGRITPEPPRPRSYAMFIESVRLPAGLPDRWPFTMEPVRHLAQRGLTFDRPVTASLACTCSTSRRPRCRSSPACGWSTSCTSSGNPDRRSSARRTRRSSRRRLARRSSNSGRTACAAPPGTNSRSSTTGATTCATPSPTSATSSPPPDQLRPRARSGNPPPPRSGAATRRPRPPAAAAARSLPRRPCDPLPAACGSPQPPLATHSGDSGSEIYKIAPDMPCSGDCWQPKRIQSGKRSARDVNVS